MKVCKYKAPNYVEAEPNHRVACHLYDDEVMKNLVMYDAEYDKIMAERARAEEEEKQSKKVLFKREKSQENNEKKES